jgi:hypothetical protein
MTVELELDDVIALVEAASAHGAAVFVAHDEKGDKLFLKVSCPKPRNHRKRVAAPQTVMQHEPIETPADYQRQAFLAQQALQDSLKGKP